MAIDCNHKTCEGKHCRRPKPKKTRTPLKRSTKRINPISKKQAKNLRKYSTLRKLFLKESDLCELRTPDCTGIATCVHHVNGRVLHLLNIDTWKRSCIACNGWVESHHKDAQEMNLKKSKFTGHGKNMEGGFGL